MNTMGQMFGASARFNLLQALFYQHRAVGLRELARLAGVHPHSAERMLKDLVKKGVVLRAKRQARVEFRRNTDHSDWRILNTLFHALDRAGLDSRRTSLNRRARAILPFIEEARRMLSCARRSIRVA